MSKCYQVSHKKIPNGSTITTRTEIDIGDFKDNQNPLMEQDGVTPIKRKPGQTNQILLVNMISANSRALSKKIEEIKREKRMEEEREKWRDPIYHKKQMDDFEEKYGKGAKAIWCPFQCEICVANNEMRKECYKLYPSKDNFNYLDSLD